MEELLEVTGETNYVLTRNLGLFNEDADVTEPGTHLADFVTGGSSMVSPIIHISGYLLTEILALD